MNPGAGLAGVIISWSLVEKRERLVFQPCINWWVSFTDPPAKYRSTTPGNAAGCPDHHSIAMIVKELYNRRVRIKYMKWPAKVVRYL